MRFEERVYHVFLQGELPGTLHQYQGQEAVAVGVCDHLSHTDWITSTHRPHGHAIAKGVTPRSAMAELYGKATGCCNGKGGSMHLGDPAVGMLPAIAIVGGGNSVVIGLGLAFKMRQLRSGGGLLLWRWRDQRRRLSRELELCRGATPADRVCVREQSVWRVHAISPGLVGDQMWRRGPAPMACPARLSMAWMCWRCIRLPARPLRQARAGNGPILLECKTYRFIGHSRSDARGYRSKDEEAEWNARDPITQSGQSIAGALGWRQQAMLDAVEADVSAVLDDAVEFSRNSPDTTPEMALEDAYA